MEPIKMPSDNLIICGTPENKSSMRADPKDGPPNPSLLKALEAVLIAGKRGLLGPAAMAAAAGTPELNLGSSNGVACREGLNTIPRWAGVEKKKKAVDEKRKAVITVIQQVEGVENLQPAPKEIWICGNSVILASRRRAEKSQPNGLQFGISTSRAHVYWHGIQAMMWEQLMPLLHEIYHLRTSPSLIIIHLGEDDLMPKNNISLIISMKNDLAILKRAFPNATIVWSSLLPRRVWKKDQHPEQMQKTQEHINRKMVDYCNEIGVHFLSHNLITSDKANLFLPDVNDLSDAGADIFIADLKKVLRFYQILG
ncbi:uncharacterized protein LOC133379987 [Rhineura floridana]|uniref:uncharacterized protein LOC133379987 n=1 Tax=Rhineura floridana TaxID=261503 RepID=UPI002AC8480F|nr:uncharacterized protein LOC133379987 [Rhineura floridana]XP_061472310.1 uncharacterized protein LOC133379987 [Rhineura floridana]XP_061472312.1 uncharacterized protein LOC133379987 [Rhineura floridana]